MQFALWIFAFLLTAHLFDRPYKGGVLLNSPQKELNLAWPSPHGSKPKGFRGFAANMINLSDDNLNITTVTCIDVGVVFSLYLEGSFAYVHSLTCISAFGDW